MELPRRGALVLPAAAALAAGGAARAQRLNNHAPNSVQAQALGGRQLPVRQGVRPPAAAAARR